MTPRKSPPIADTDETLRWRRMREPQFAKWAAGCRVRAEWVDGEALILPADSLEGDDFGNWIRSFLLIFVEHFDLGSVHGPRFTVRLGKQRRRRLPDVLFVARRRKKILTANHVEGGPDLIMEVVSPDSVSRDWREKFIEYEKARVQEYWILDPQAGRVEAYRLVRRRYERIDERDEKLVSVVLEGMYLRPEWVRTGMLPRGTKVLREWGVTI